MEAMDKITEDLEDAVRRHNSINIVLDVNKLRENCRSGLVPVKGRNGVTISDKQRVKEEKWAEHFETVLNRDRFVGKEIEENEKKGCDTWMLRKICSVRKN